MAQLMKCRSCGFVIEQGKLKDVCPACGVPVKMFEPYTDPVSEKRRMILGFHIHPIIDHFPQSFAFSTFILAVCALFITGAVRDSFLCAIKVIAAFTPLVVLFAFLSGLLDGKIRFRRVTTPILKRKMLFGSLFFICSIIMLVLALSPGFEAGAKFILYIIINFIAFTCSMVLGLLGTSLLDAKFPG